MTYGGVPVTLSSEITEKVGMTSHETLELIRDRTTTKEFIASEKDTRYTCYVLVDEFTITRYKRHEVFGDAIMKWHVVNSSSLVEYTSSVEH